MALNKKAKIGIIVAVVALLILLMIVAAIFDKKQLKDEDEEKNKEKEENGKEKEEKKEEKKEEQKEEQKEGKNHEATPPAKNTEEQPKPNFKDLPKVQINEENKKLYDKGIKKISAFVPDLYREDIKLPEVSQKQEMPIKQPQGKAQILTKTEIKKHQIKQDPPKPPIDPPKPPIDPANPPSDVPNPPQPDTKMPPKISNKSFKHKPIQSGVGFNSNSSSNIDKLVLT